MTQRARLYGGRGIDRVRGKQGKARRIGRALNLEKEGLMRMESVGRHERCDGRVYRHRSHKTRPHTTYRCEKCEGLVKDRRDTPAKILWS